MTAAHVPGPSRLAACSPAPVSKVSGPGSSSTTEAGSPLLSDGVCVPASNQAIQQRRSATTAAAEAVRRSASGNTAAGDHACESLHCTS